MKILLATYVLQDRTGVELYTRELAHALAGRGHEVLVYAVNAGDLAREMEAEGVRIVRRLGDISPAPDLIHAHNQPALIEVLAAFPQTPAIYVIHDAVSPLDEPFPFHRVRRHVAVDERCLRRIALNPEISERQRCVILNFVDLARFGPRPPLPDRPRRALVFSNYAKAPAELAAIQAACDQAGLSLEMIGKAAGRVSETPEAVLGGYDIVFAKARAAIEAMAVGCAVVLCDFAGLGEMVTSPRFEHLRAWNFGAGVLTAPITREGVAAQIARYAPSDAAKVSARIREESGLEVAVDAWLALYAQVLAEPGSADTPDQRRRLAHAARHWNGLRRVDRLRARTRRLRDNPSTGALYRLGRGLWRAAGSPGAWFR